MIRLVRPAAPNGWTARARRSTDVLVKKVEDDPAGFSRSRRPRKLGARSSIYRSQEVVDLLLEAQHHKCAYCEHPIRAAQAGEVDHFRPKGAVQQESADPLERPGYYWLAYSWENLLLACSRCNGSPNKGNRFPLGTGGVRAKRPSDSLAAEHPLLVDPFVDEPAEHLSWDAHDPVPLSERGRASITVYGLSRDALREARMTRIAEVEAMLHALQALRRLEPDGSLLQEIEGLLPSLLGPSARFSACVHAACADLIDALDPPELP